MKAINLSGKSYIYVRDCDWETMNPSGNGGKSYESVREEPVNTSENNAGTYESVRNKTVQPPVNPSVNGYECVRMRLWMCPNTPVNPSGKNYRSVRKHRPTLLDVRQLRHGLLYTLSTLCCNTHKNILINSDRFIVFFVLRKTKETGYMARPELGHSYSTCTNTPANRSSETRARIRTSL